MITPLQRVCEVLAIGVSIWLMTTAWHLSPEERGYGTHEQLGLTPCGFLETTGHPCPSCGMTTSFSYMAEARPMAGMQANPAGAVLFLLVLVTPFWILHSWAKGFSSLRFLEGNRGGWWLLGACLLVLFSWYYKDRIMLGG